MRNEYPERDLFSPEVLKDFDISKEDCSARLKAILYALKTLYYERPDMVRLVYEDLSGNTDPCKGREGMNAWRTLLLIAVRTGLDIDYDMLYDLANNHEAIRKFMGVSLTEDFHPSRSTIHDNIMLLSKETIEAVNDALVEIGVKKKFEDGSAVRGDSFVCRTNTHYPTDVRLVRDGVESIIRLCVEHSGGKQGWRQHNHLQKKTARLYRSYMQVKRSTRKRGEKAADLEAALETYLKHARTMIEKALQYMAEHTDTEAADAEFPVQDRPEGSLEEQLSYFLAGTEYMCRLAERRCLEGEQIPHEDKVHSLYEPHAELINRGKYPTPIEFGHRVFLAQGKSGLILNHRVMGIGVTDDKILIPVLKELEERFKSKLEVASFDKGFYTPENLIRGKEHCNLVVIPKKGRLSTQDKAHQGSKEYQEHRQWRAGVESLISAMVRSNGLDKCPDKGYAGFVKYVSACVLSRNLQTLGNLLIAEEKEKQKRKYKKRA